MESQHRQNNAEATGLSAVRSSRGYVAEKGSASDPNLEQLAKSSEKNAARASQSFLKRSKLTLDVPISHVEVGEKPFETCVKVMADFYFTCIQRSRVPLLYVQRFNVYKGQEL